jgi:hypothetical protein
MVMALVLGGCEFDYKPGAKMPQIHPTKNDLKVGSLCTGKGVHKRYWVGSTLPRPAYEAGITATAGCVETKVKLGWMNTSGQQWTSMHYDSSDGTVDGVASYVVATGTNKAKNYACGNFGACDSEET